jgi:hypothetical protein
VATVGETKIVFIIFVRKPLGGRPLERERDGKIILRWILGTKVLRSVVYGNESGS